jgi:hypothetical protein
MSIRTLLADFTAPLVLAALSGCQAAQQPTAPMDPVDPSFSTHAGATGSARGGGHFDAGVDVTFSFGVVQLDGFEAVGQLHFSTEIDGEAVEFHGRAICLTIDAVNDRAWIGGVVTQNNSTRPAFTQPIHDAGRDIWFRVVDYGEGQGAPQVDRATFVGFEGSADIITSVEYCETQPWPDEDARTNPLTQGNIQVRAR